MAYSQSVRLHVVSDTPEPVLNNIPGTLYSTVIFTGSALFSLLIHTLESRCILARDKILFEILGLVQRNINKKMANKVNTE